MTQGPENQNAEQSEIVITTDQMFHDFAELCLRRGSHVKTDTDEDGNGFMLVGIPPLLDKGIKAVAYKPPYMFEGEPVGNSMYIEFDDPEIQKVIDLYVDESGHVTRQILTLESKFVDSHDVQHLQEIAEDPNRDALIDEAIRAFEQQDGFSDNPDVREVQHRLLFTMGELTPSPADMLAAHEALAATKQWDKA